MADLLTAKKVKDEYGYSRSSLLRFEESGLIAPQRTPGGQRRYTRDQIESLSSATTDADGATPQQVRGDAAFGEFGVTGLRRWGGGVYEERLEQLRGRKGRLLYREMRLNDPVIAAVFFAVVNSVKQADWKRIIPASDGAADREAADFVESCMEDLSWSWNTQLTFILEEMFEQGFAVNELVYKKRLGENPPAYTADPAKSLHDDGRTGWRKWSPRPAMSLQEGDEWIFDVHGGIKGINQLPDTGETKGVRRIHIEKLLHYRTTVHPANNPEGLPIHRSMYIPYFYTQNYMEIEGIGVERDIGGLATMYLGRGATLSGPNSDYEKAKALVRNVRLDDQMGVVIPGPKLGTAGDGEGYLLELLASESRRQHDISKIIDRYDKRKALGVLAQFIMLGMERVGSYALSQHQGDLFVISVTSWLESVAEVMNRHAVRKLFTFNTFPGITGLPRIEPGAIGIPNLRDISEFINKLVDKAVIVPDDGLESHMRQLAGLPPQQDDAGEIREELIMARINQNPGLAEDEGEESESEPNEQDNEDNEDE